MSKSVYLGLRFGAPLPDEYMDWRIAMETGWTLEYIRSLSMEDFHNYLQIADGTAKARQR